MTDNILLNKAATIERCVQRVNEEYNNCNKNLAASYTHQDAIILNIQRACEVAIDMAMHVVRVQHLGLPQSSREAFVLLEQAKLIPTELSHELQAMVGFRNIAIHNYIQLNLDIVKAIIETKLDQFLKFSRLLLS